MDVAADGQTNSKKGEEEFFRKGESYRYCGLIYLSIEYTRELYL